MRCIASTLQKRSSSTGTLACALLSLLLTLFAAHAVRATKKPPKRPHILGIAGVTIYVSDIPEARKYYLNLIDPDHVCDYCRQAPSRYLFLPSGQRITLEQVPSPPPADLLADISFLTDDIEEFKRYLNFHKIELDEIRKKHGGDVVSLLLEDPEKHHISITDRYHIANGEDLNAGLAPANPTNPIRIIHAGFVVNSREAIDHFYVDLLGFRPYWHGGMTEDTTSWVAMQVPDGTDWVEYMLNIPANADKHTLGVMNHIALGVPDIHVIADKLTAIGVKAPEPPKIGRDGKWQLNLYDADQTRAEFMEFKPVQKPCCSDFTGPHPGSEPSAQPPQER
jgi:catechol 2,3-dioxygenase-like lactoylglutathione lyase family enzyme